MTLTALNMFPQFATCNPSHGGRRYAESFADYSATQSRGVATKEITNEKPQTNSQKKEKNNNERLNKLLGKLHTR